MSSRLTHTHRKSLRLNIPVSEALRERIRAAAQAEDRTIRATVTRALMIYLERHHPE